MLRIAFIVHTFAAGGLERCVSRLASRLDRCRYQPLIICLAHSGSAAAWLERDDIPIHEMHKRPGHDLGMILRLARLLREEHVHLVHSHNWGSLLETVVARRLAVTPLQVHAERGFELAELHASPWRRRARDLLAGMALRTTNAVVTVSEELRRRTVAMGVPQARVHLVPNGIDALPVQDRAAERARIRSALGVEDHTVLACCVGRLVPVKNLAMVVRAMGCLPAGGPDVRLVLVGDGPERDALQTAAGAAGLADRIHFAGVRADIGAWLAASDIFVNSSLYEGMSQAVLEAMAAGLPVLVTDVGENAMLAGGQEPCGIVVPSGDSRALAEGLHALATDPERRALLGRRALARQRREYSLDRMVARYDQLYTALAQEAALPLLRVPATRRP